MSGLHYKKDGSLDMRYSSSRAAMSSGYGYSSGGGGGGYNIGGSSYGSSSSSSYSNNNNVLHYKKDGSLDMRYSSSKAAVASSGGSSTYRPSSSGTADLHYKKDGSLDMRYSSSKAAVSGSLNNNNDLHYKKDGSLDMRYSSSKAAASQLNSAFNKMALGNSSTGSKSSVIPSHIPLTKSGAPDMRTKVAKEWVAKQAASCTTSLPTWLPTKKDGSLDTTKAVVQEFLANQSSRSSFDHNRRQQYYNQQMLDDGFAQLVTAFRNPANCSEAVQLPEPRLLANTQELKRCMSEVVELRRDQPLSQLISTQVKASLSEIKYDAIRFGDEKTAQIGRGGFGVVLKGTWNGKTVAVKRMHLEQLTRNDKLMFAKEIKVLALVGQHENLVSLYGYCVEPPCMVMEFIELGSLSNVLHYIEDVQIQAAITDGRTKRKIAMGVAAGMYQLHEVGVIHGDLKPQNVLLTKSFTAKITDFGLATLRGRTSSSMVSSKLLLDGDGDNVIGGTGAYMAPELLDSGATGPPDYSADVYSFGILLNELITEEEPYSGEERNFAGRGVYGVVHYAKQGKRPFIKADTPAGLKKLIEDCWSRFPASRPLFPEIIRRIKSIDFPNSC